MSGIMPLLWVFQIFLNLSSDEVISDLTLATKQPTSNHKRISMLWSTLLRVAGKGASLRDVPQKVCFASVESSTKRLHR